MSAALITAAIAALHWLAGLIVVAEALNKLERTDLFGHGRTPLQRLACLHWLATPWRWRRPTVVLALKLFAWALLAIGGAGALVTPLLGLERPTLQDAAALTGFAVLILRSRLKEMT